MYVDVKRLFYGNGKLKKIATFYDRFTQPKDAKTRPMQHVVVVRLETTAFELWINFKNTLVNQ